MPSKKDLGAFKKPSLKSVLAETQETRKPEQKTSKGETIPAPKKEKGKVGRKAKPKAEKESEMVGLMLTPSEMVNLKKNAGLVNLGTFLKHHLRTETDLLK